ncbi:FecR family protein, partial [Devosia pacifica]|uniref:FecR family protein n=1 Tax=Devosia pacifica TaxID=1335967 RepID=UPI001676FEC6
MSIPRTILSRLVFVAAFVAALCGGALAGEWRVDSLRGLVFVHQDAAWTPLELGDVITDDQVIRTLASGRVELVRDAERIELAGETQLAVREARQRKFTTVQQYYGKVTIDAEAQNVQHFAVQTPYLAAVVKGTRFTVISRNGRSEVEVERGRVQVDDTVHRVRVDITRGQSARVSEGEVLRVESRGETPQIYTFDGVAATPAQLEQISQASAAGGSASNSSGTSTQIRPSVARSSSDRSGSRGSSAVGSDENGGGNGNGGGNSGN